MKSIKNLVQNIFIKIGYNLIKYKKNNDYNGFILNYNFLHSDFDEFHKKIIKLVKNYTMTSPERLYTLIEAVKYLNLNNIKGDIVECGVWRGGSMMTIAETLVSLEDTNRQLYLFDTFEGMPEPNEVLDIDSKNNSAKKYMIDNAKSEDDFIWAFAPLDLVKYNINSTKYPSHKVTYIKGMVEETLPNNSIEKIALLRLDTDWYSSTKHELNTLYKLIVKGGILIIDDYGHWNGAKLAVDEYIKENNITIFLNRIDYSGRIAIKQ